MNLKNVLGPEIGSEIKSLSGDAGIVIKDLSDGESYAFGENNIFPIASIIKLMILWELFYRIDQESIALSDKRELSDSLKVGGFGILKNMDNGLELTIHDLATLMIILSDNVATNMLIDELGMDEINEKALELELKNTKLQRKMMDGEAKAKGLDNFSSPSDVAILLEQYVNYELLSKASRKTMLDILQKQQCNNKLPKLLPIDFPLAHKTGDLPGTEHDAGIFEFEKRKVIVVVLTKNLQRNEDGILLCRKIGKLVYDTYTKQNM